MPSMNSYEPMKEVELVAEPRTSFELELFASAQNWKKHWSASMIRHLRGAVVEVGAGIGSNSEHLLSSGIEQLTSLEPDEQLFSVLSARNTARRVTCVRGTLADLDQKFDSIVYIDVLEHIEDDESETSCAYDHLTTGGNLIILAPAWQFLFSPFDHAVGHYRRYTRASLRSVVDPRLETVSEKYLDSVGLLASLGNRVFLSSSVPTRRQIEFWDSVMMPLSGALDPLLRYSVGKTVLGVYRRP